MPDLYSVELPRKDLATFLPSQRAIVAFENVIKDLRQVLGPAVDTAADSVADLEASASSALAAARAAEALAHLAAVIALDLAAGPPPVPATSPEQDETTAQLVAMREELAALRTLVNDLQASPP